VRSRWTVALCIACLAIASSCSSSDTKSAAKSTTTTIVDPGAGWNATALANAHGMASTLRSAGIACDKDEPTAYGAIAADYANKLPLPAAILECDSHGENLTFEIFVTKEQTDAFLAKKQALICKSAKDKHLEHFPGFAYARGDAWIVEPDEKSTADRIAPVLDGESKVAACE
jgi:hypothetical protein